MKKLILIPAALSLIFAAGCKKDEQPEKKDGKKVEFVIEETATRTVTEGNTTRFVEGDKIGVTSSGLASEMNNAQFTVGADGKLTGSAFYYDGDETATFFAHYPTSAAYAAGSVSMTVGTDQSTTELFNANDFMTSTATGDPAVNNGLVSLKFYHRLTLVKVKWSVSTEALSISLDNIKPVMTWKHSDNSLTASGDAISIKSWKQADSQEFWALVPAQTIAAGTGLVTITCNGKTFNYTTAGDVTFNANTIKTITLSLAQDDAVEAVFSDIEIENWGTDDVDGGGNVTEVVLPPVELITLAESRNITLTPNSKSNAESGKWNVAVDNVNTENPSAGNVIEFADGALHLNIKAFETETGNLKTATSKWWNNAVYYRPSEELADKIMPTLYRLTFKVSTSAAGRGFMVQVMKGDAEGNIYFGITNLSLDKITEETTWNRMYYPVIKAENWVEGQYYDQTFYIDFSKIVSTDGKSITAGKYGDYQKVLLTFSINTGGYDSETGADAGSNGFGYDFYFKDIVLEEVK